jgi:hypothetical protein
MQSDLDGRDFLQGALEKGCKPFRSDGRRDSDVKHAVAPHRPVLRVIAHAPQRQEHTTEFRFNILAEAREPAVLSVPIDQCPAEFFLDTPLNRAASVKFSVSAKFMK